MSASQDDQGNNKPHAMLTPQQSSQIEAVLDREIGPLVGPAKAPDVIKRTVDVLHKTEIFSGPLPPPSLMSAYEDIFPGFAERIMAMAEKEQNNRHAMQAIEVRHSADLEKYSLWTALIFGIALIGGASYCAYVDQTTLGCALVGAFGLGGLTLFFKGRPEQEKQLSSATTRASKNASHGANAVKTPKRRR
jgi:uncharacterized membrane protein